MQNKYKLLVSDIDGTITDGNGVISDVDFKAVRDLQQAGITLSLCTGRAARGCQKVLERLSPDGFHIFFDGALVCNADQSVVIYARPITKDLLMEICDIAHSYGMTLELFSKAQFFVECESPLAKVHSELMNFNCTATNFTTLYNRESIIMGCLVIPAVEEKKFKLLFSKFEKNLKVKFSWAMNPAQPNIRFANIIMNDVSKGKALEALCSHMGLKIEETAAIGDGVNDISLLSAAGLALAMQNAPPELKAVADYVTGDIEHHGFAQAVRKFLL
jgi:Cof subfamily protein (haloacid dehalogenase superfamily)